MHALNLGGAIVLGMAAAAAAADSATALAQAREKLVAGRYVEARQLASELIETDPKSKPALTLRAAANDALGDHAAAVADYDELVRLEPNSAGLYDARGSQKFMLGQFVASIDDFDRAIQLRPELERGHWKRGISYYYAGRYDDGRKQFEGYQQVDGNDVENAVWRFLCMARAGDLATARREMLKIKNDRRVPLMQIYALFNGQGDEQAVKDAVAAGDPSPAELNSRQFYAELYLGLYHEATGDKQAALEYLRTAEKHSGTDYMGEVARVHAGLLSASK